MKLGHDGISHAAIDMICTLMEPMHENYDLKQEQLNKSSLLSSEKFLEGLLDMWTLHVVNIQYSIFKICLMGQIFEIFNLLSKIFYSFEYINLLSKIFFSFEYFNLLRKIIFF